MGSLSVVQARVALEAWYRSGARSLRLVAREALEVWLDDASVAAPDETFARGHALQALDAFATNGRLDLPPEGEPSASAASGKLVIDGDLVDFTMRVQRTPAGVTLTIRLGSAPPGTGGIGTVRVAVQHPNGYRVTVDPGRQRLSLDVIEDERLTDEPRLFATVARALGPVESRPTFVCDALLAHVAKLFDDRVIACLEEAAHDGWEGVAGKDQLVRALVERTRALTGRPEGTDPVMALRAAAVLGGHADSTAEPGLESVLAAFRAEPMRSHPIGIYTQSEKLQRVFRQDRMLQSRLAPGPRMDAALRALREESALRSAYARHLRLAKRLTDRYPPGHLDLLDLAPGQDPGEHTLLSWYPPSDSPEAVILKELFGSRPCPENFRLARELGRRIRDESLSLQPVPDAGWRARALWALEPLVAPDRGCEAAQLLLTPGYVAYLERLFEAGFAMSRETHTKQLESLMLAGCGLEAGPEISVRPALSLEPHVTGHTRRALSYTFLARMLREELGDAVARLVLPGGEPLAEGVQRLERLFLSAARVAADELGLPPEARPPELADVTGDAFHVWRDGLRADPELEQDTRFMVPLFQELSGRIRVWMFLGYEVRMLGISFTERVQASAVDASGKPVRVSKVTVGAQGEPVFVPVVRELFTRRLLPREEFRALCDRFRCASQLVAHLSSE